VFLHLEHGGVRSGADLSDAGHPLITIHALGPEDLGRIFFLSEFATAVAGWVLGINPFDQPNVQEAKDNTNRVLNRDPTHPAADLPDGDLSELLDGLAPPHYFAIMGYLPYSGETEAAIARLRTALIERFHVATTWGYGPRFLHSTGQFHKGGPRTGRFLQLIDVPASDLEVPGEPFTFGTLVRAQADGDLQTLRDHGLPAVRVVVGDIDQIKERL
jgi:glucose-6-phosphate isomerase/transaldolase/glucose-6-phosphate isomerase